MQIKRNEVPERDSAEKMEEISNTKNGTREEILPKIEIM